MRGIAGKVAIVTGGGSGLGESIGKMLAGNGAKVVLSDINLKAAERVAGEIQESGGTASAFQQDTAQADQSNKVVPMRFQPTAHFTTPSTTRALAVQQPLREKRICVNGSASSTST